MTRCCPHTPHWHGPRGCCVSGCECRVTELQLESARRHTPARTLILTVTVDETTLDRAAFAAHSAMYTDHVAAAYAWHNVPGDREFAYDIARAVLASLTGGGVR